MTFIIPYGAQSLDPGRISITPDGAVACPAPHVVIDSVVIDSAAGEPLRLNGGQYAFPEPPNLRTMTDATIQAEFLGHHLAGFCDLWNKPAARFLTTYFDFVAAEVENHKSKLIEGLAPFGGIYDYKDWMLPAPRPLPRAWIASTADDGGYIPVDFAFWQGGRMLAILTVGSGTPTKRDRERKDALSAAGVEIVEIAAQDDLADKLPTEFLAF